MAYRLIALILWLISATVSASGLFGGNKQPQFLPEDQAFRFTWQQQDQRLDLNWQISPGYYLYRKQIEISPENASLVPPQLPPGEPHEDEFFGKTDIYRNQLHLPLTLNHAQQGAIVTITYQGCTAGLCYPPKTQQITLNAWTPPPGSATNTSATNPPPPATTTTQGLPFSPLWAILIGIGVAFTPCVLPMYPLISGIVLGGKQRLSTPRALWLGLVYVQGMALAYTALGIVVALAGLQFQAALQSAPVLITLSVIFGLLALSMFGLFTLQLPSALQTRLTLISNRQQGGSTGGVFTMGAIGGLICSPCTTAPLSAILLYIAQSGNLAQGGGTLYLYAIGMGLPLILVTVFGNRLLPKSGPWMEKVKTGFGFIILALPVFLLERVVSPAISLRLWALLGMTFFAWAFITSLSSQRRVMRLVQIFCLGAALIVSRPLQDWVFQPPAAIAASHLNFQHIQTAEELEQILAQTNGKPVMLDLYADWCTACKEFEKYTFSNPQVQQALANTLLLQIDMTHNSAENTALLNKLNVLGLPSILFFNPQGTEEPHLRVTGFLNAERFLAHLQSLPAS